MKKDSKETYSEVIFTRREKKYVLEEKKEKNVRERGFHSEKSSIPTHQSNTLNTMNTHGNIGEYSNVSGGDTANRTPFENSGICDLPPVYTQPNPQHTLNKVNLNFSSTNAGKAVSQNSDSANELYGKEKILKSTHSLREDYSKKGSEGNKSIPIHKATKSVQSIESGKNKMMRKINPQNLYLNKTEHIQNDGNQVAHSHRERDDDSGDRFSQRRKMVEKNADRTIMTERNHNERNMIDKNNQRFRSQIKHDANLEKNDRITFAKYKKNRNNHPHSTNPNYTQSNNNQNISANPSHSHVNTINFNIQAPTNSNLINSINPLMQSSASVNNFNNVTNINNVNLNINHFKNVLANELPSLKSAQTYNLNRLLKKQFKKKQKQVPLFVTGGGAGLSHNSALVKDKKNFQKEELAQTERNISHTYTKSTEKSKSQMKNKKYAKNLVSFFNSHSHNSISQKHPSDGRKNESLSKREGNLVEKDSKSLKSIAELNKCSLDSGKGKEKLKGVKDETEIKELNKEIVKEKEKEEWEKEIRIKLEHKLSKEEIEELSKGKKKGEENTESNNAANDIKKHYTLTKVKSMKEMHTVNSTNAANATNALNRFNTMKSMDGIRKIKKVYLETMSFDNTNVSDALAPPLPLNDKLIPNSQIKVNNHHSQKLSSNYIHQYPQNQFQTTFKNYSETVLHPASNLTLNDRSKSLSKKHYTILKPHELIQVQNQLKLQQRKTNILNKKSSKKQKQIPVNDQISFKSDSNRLHLDLLNIIGSIQNYAQEYQAPSDFRASKALQVLSKISQDKRITYRDVIEKVSEELATCIWCDETTETNCHLLETLSELVNIPFFIKDPETKEYHSTLQNSNDWGDEIFDDFLYLPNYNTLSKNKKKGLNKYSPKKPQTFYHIANKYARISSHYRDMNFRIRKLARQKISDLKKQCEIKDSRIKELNGKLEVIEEKEKIRENNVDPLFEKKTQEMDIKYYIDKFQKAKKEIDGLKYHIREMQEELNNGQDRYTFAMEDTNKFKMLFNQAESDFFALKKKYNMTKAEYEELKLNHFENLEVYKDSVTKIRECRDRINTLEKFNESLSVANSKLTIRAAVSFEELTPRYKYFDAIFDEFIIKKSQRSDSSLVHSSSSESYTLKSLPMNVNNVINNYGSVDKIKDIVLYMRNLNERLLNSQNKNREMQKKLRTMMQLRDKNKRRSSVFQEPKTTQYLQTSPKPQPCEKGRRSSSVYSRDQMKLAPPLKQRNSFFFDKRKQKTLTNTNESSFSTPGNLDK